VPTLGTLALFSAILALLTVSFWLVPVALGLGVAWALWNVVTQFEDLSYFGAFKRSWVLVRPQLKTVLAVLGLAVLVGSFIGGLLAALLFVLVQLPASVLNTLPGLISTVLQPFIALMLTYVYFSALARAEGDSGEESADVDDDLAESPA
jgi:hypothetical protein